MKSVIGGAMPSTAIAGKASNTVKPAAMNAGANKAGFTQPGAAIKGAMGGTPLRSAVTKPTAHSYKAADFTVQMNMEGANNAAQDR